MNIRIPIILGKLHIMGRIDKWRSKLSKFYIMYERKIYIKAHVLEDILVKFPVEVLDGAYLDCGPDRVELPVNDETVDTVVVLEYL